VNSTTDPGSDGCDAVECTFREAVEAANANPGADEILFDLHGAGVHTLQQSPDFPALTGPTVVDGYSQPGASPNTLDVGSNALLLVQTAGLTISGGYTTVRGLIFSGRYPMSIVVSDSPGNVANVIEGCWIVTTASGDTNSLPFGGIASGGNENTAALRIGGPTPAQRNVINSGETLLGGYHPAFDIASDDAIIINNYIGTDKTGTQHPLNGSGPAIVRARAQFGGSSAAERNVVSTGVWVLGGSDTVIEGNYLGIRADGMAPLDGGGESLISVNSGTGHVIRNNVVGGVGARTAVGVALNASSSAVGSTRIVGNWVGVGSDGVVPLPVDRGLVVFSRDDPGLGGLEVGGMKPGDGNVIANVTRFGIEVHEVAQLRILGNRIGLDVDGNPGHGGTHGVIVGGGSQNVQIGSPVLGGGNEIAFSDGPGVGILSGDGVLVSGNSIHSNGGIAIDLGDGFNADGPTPNDSLDVDSGANGLLNHPVIEKASRTSGGVALDFSFETEANSTDLRVEAFRSDRCSAGFADAQHLVAEVDGVASDESGLVMLRMEFWDSALRGFYSATLIDNQGNTSEVSPCVSLPADLIYGNGFE
jgi:hypothetical protein